MAAPEPKAEPVKIYGKRLVGIYYPDKDVFEKEKNVEWSEAAAGLIDFSKKFAEANEQLAAIIKDSANKKEVKTVPTPKAKAPKTNAKGDELLSKPTPKPEVKSAPVSK